MQAGVTNHKIESASTLSDRFFFNWMIICTQMLPAYTRIQALECAK